MCYSSKRCAIKTLYTTRIGQRYYLPTLITDVFYCISYTTLTSVFFQLYWKQLHLYYCIKHAIKQKHISIKTWTKFNSTVRLELTTSAIKHFKWPALNDLANIIVTSKFATQYYKTITTHASADSFNTISLLFRSCLEDLRRF